MLCRPSFRWIALAGLLFVLLGVVMAEDEQEADYYAVLGLSDKREDATEREIKTAWRRLSKSHHPDLTGTTDRTHYQRIQRAYEVLGDRRRRKVFDILGHEGIRKMEQPQAQRQQHPLAQLFGGEGPMDAERDRGKDVQLLLVVTLEDVYSGAAHGVTLNKRKICRACRGTGARSAQDLVACPHCRGSGHTVRRVQIMPGFVQQLQQPCPHCKGSGRHVAAKCPVCRGRQVVDGDVTISVDVEAGTPEGHVISYELEADQSPGQVPGDVQLTVVTAPHPRFERAGNDLHTVVNLTLREALLGVDRVLTHLDGHLVELQRVGVTQYGTVIKILGEGMPKLHVPSERGDLYVHYHVQLPCHLAEDQKTILQRLFAAMHP